MGTVSKHGPTPGRRMPVLGVEPICAQDKSTDINIKFAVHVFSLVSATKSKRFFLKKYMTKEEVQIETEPRLCLTQGRMVLLLEFSKSMQT